MEIPKFDWIATNADQKDAARKAYPNHNTDEYSILFKGNLNQAESVSDALQFASRYLIITTLDMNFLNGNGDRESPLVLAYETGELPGDGIQRRTTFCWHGALSPDQQADMRNQLLNTANNRLARACLPTIPHPLVP